MPSNEDGILLSQQERLLSINRVSSDQKDVYEHLLQLFKAFFKKRMLNGKNIFKVLAKCFDQEDIHWKVFELLFVVTFFCKDISSDLDFYYNK